MTATLGIHTLHVEHAFLLAVYTLLTLLNSRMHKGVSGIHWFSLYNILAFLGAVLVASRGHVSDPVSIVVASVFVSAGYVTLFLSLARFFASPLSALYLQLGVVALSLAPMVQYGWLHPDTTRRLFVYSVVLASLQAHTAWFTFRRNKPRTYAGTSMAVMLGLLCLTNLCRLFSLAAHNAPLDYLQAGNELAFFVLINSALQCGTMVSYVWMTASLLQQDLILQASTDSMTGVLNRRALDLAASRVLAAAEAGDCTSAISIDLDHFKKINDCCGHSCGDAALVAFARCMQQGLRQGDFLGRMGGDEFVILLPRTSVATARMIAARLHHLVREHHFVYQQARITLSASFGVAQVTHPEGDWDHLLSECDKLLYAAKRSRPRISSLSHDQFFPRSEDGPLLHPQSFATNGHFQ